MIWYALVIFVFTADGPSVIANVFADRTTCEVVEGQILTDADKRVDVGGWVVTEPCSKLQEAKKS